MVSSANGSGPGDVALLIDWENLKWGLQNNFQAAPNISSLVQAAEEHGRLVLSRAYADWTHRLLRVDAPNLYRAGIEPVYVPGSDPHSGTTIKNSADIRMAVDAVALTQQMRHIGIYMLVTGDSDLLHLVHYLRLNGCVVIAVGVGDAMSGLLAAAADDVLIYEEDIEPITERATPARRPAGVVEDAPPVDEVFLWAAEILRERTSNGSYPLTQLGHDLKRRHGLDARRWYEISLKDLILRAQQAGHVTIRTSAGQDFVSLPGEGNLAVDATTAPDGRETLPGWSAEFEDLYPAEQFGLLSFLSDLQASSPYMTFGYIVSNAVDRSVLPRFSEEQISDVINQLVGRHILIRESRTGILADEPAVEVTIFQLNSRHIVVKDVLESGRAQIERAHDAAFEEVLPALDAASNRSFPAVQRAVEDRLGRKLQELGYQRPSLFFRAVEERGLIEINQLENGGWIVMRPGEAANDVEELTDGFDRRELGRLGDCWRDEVFRILAAVEDQLDGQIAQNGSLLLHIRHTLPRQGGPRLKSGEATRLLQRELVGCGYVLELEITGLDPRSGVPRPVTAYRLNRDHPDVARALCEGQVDLDPRIDVRAVRTAAES